MHLVIFGFPTKELRNIPNGRMVVTVESTSEVVVRLTVEKKADVAQIA